MGPNRIYDWDADEASTRLVSEQFALADTIDVMREEAAESLRVAHSLGKLSLASVYLYLRHPGQIRYDIKDSFERLVLQRHAQVLTTQADELLERLLNRE